MDALFVVVVLLFCTGGFLAIVYGIGKVMGSGIGKIVRKDK